MVKGQDRTSKKAWPWILTVGTEIFGGQLGVKGNKKSIDNHFIHSNINQLLLSLFYLYFKTSTANDQPQGLKIYFQV